MSQHDDHGSMQSYVTGFALSILFTLIPYFLVVKEIITGRALLVTILGFALIQMVIQMTFFIHLGRGPKPNWNLYFFGSTFAIILVVVAGSIMIINNLHYNMSPTDQVKKLVGDEGIAQVNGNQTGACQELGENHQVTIKDGQVVPTFTSTKRCDTFTFINDDSEAKVITFGTPPEQSAYAGQSEIKVEKSKSETITLSDKGVFRFYDKTDTNAIGAFTVSQLNEDR